MNNGRSILKLLEVDLKKSIVKQAITDLDQTVDKKYSDSSYFHYIFRIQNVVFNYPEVNFSRGEVLCCNRAKFNSFILKCLENQQENQPITPKFVLCIVYILNYTKQSMDLLIQVQWKSFLKKILYPPSYRHGMCFRGSSVFVLSILFRFPQHTHYF